MICRELSTDYCEILSLIYLRAGAGEQGLRNDVGRICNLGYKKFCQKTEVAAAFAFLASFLKLPLFISFFHAWHT